MNILMKHVHRSSVLACAWEYCLRKWNVDTVNGMYLKIYYSFRLPDKRGKIMFETMDWIKEMLIGEVIPPAET